MGMDQAQLATVLMQTAGQLSGSISGNTDRSEQRQMERQAALREIEARDKAEQEQRRAREDRDQLRKQQRRDQARNRTHWGSSGVVLSSGSPLSVMEGQAADDAMEQAEVLAQGDRAASRELVAGRRAADHYRQRTRTNRSGSLLSGGADLFKWMLPSTRSMNF
ncbi:hypothetical protein SAMN02745704_01924 [Paucidesulfovibrio gracilis DSM 16080]|uniref:Uncharacterized protein n=1 Tax=Paucidesulfovibrio gracilis DSM 16080 TaxID=1121449 RepID=A0A1T4XAD0_9BACT|nr:hypothetical protein [Paucidesulfovibrio gracilis]SKA85831.1 hypothetical protein SAMN02745704_01924 [Paucidesulfovibrio gracilis DSM 16080]